MLLFIHACCMMMFFVFLSAGVGVARYLKNRFKHNRKTQYTSRSWVSIHSITALVALLLASVGIAASFFMVERVRDGSHFQSVHGIVGCILYILTCVVVPLFGTTSPLLSIDTNEEPLPVIYIKLHRWLGYGLWFGLIFNLALGYSTWNRLYTK